MKKPIQMDKKRLLRETDHLTRPPRLEGKAKNAGMNPTRKKRNAPHKQQRGRGEGEE